MALLSNCWSSLNRIFVNNVNLTRWLRWVLTNGLFIDDFGWDECCAFWGSQFCGGRFLRDRSELQSPDMRTSGRASGIFYEFGFVRTKYGKSWSGLLRDIPSFQESNNCFEPCFPRSSELYSGNSIIVFLDDTRSPNILETAFVSPRARQVQIRAWKAVLGRAIPLSYLDYLGDTYFQKCPLCSTERRVPYGQKPEEKTRHGHLDSSDPDV